MTEKYALHIYTHPRETIMFDDFDTANAAREILNTNALIYRLNGDVLEYYSKFSRAFVKSMDLDNNSAVREALKGD